MRSNTLYLILPFAALTATGLLATDLYLPAVPTLPVDLQGTVPQAQATLAVFLAALALSQLVWGVAADRYGGRAILKWAIVLQVIAGIACALAPSLTLLIAARGVQGLGVGAANVVVTLLVRQRFSEADSVRAMSWLGIAESMVPAAGPIAGAALLTVTTWRASFWIVAAITLCAGPLALRALPAARSPARPAAIKGYGPLLRDRGYLGYALGHALCFAALLTFVASAPQVIAVWLGGAPRDFALLQVFGVSAFVLTAAQGGRLAAPWHRCADQGWRGPANRRRGGDAAAGAG